MIVILLHIGVSFSRYSPLALRVMTLIFHPHVHEI